MRNLRIFQSSRGRFTAGIQVMPDGRVLATYALCGPKDRYVRRTGFDRVVGLFKSGQNPPLEVGNVDPSSNLVQNVFDPWYAALATLDTTEFAQHTDRTGEITATIKGVLSLSTSVV